MNSEREITGPKTILGLDRLGFSRLGNPRWRVTFTDGTVMQTKADSQIGCLIDNGEYHDAPLMVTANRAGRITDLTVVTA